RSAPRRSAARNTARCPRGSSRRTPSCHSAPTRRAHPQATTHPPPLPATRRAAVESLSWLWSPTSRRLSRSPLISNSARRGHGQPASAGCCGLSGLLHAAVTVRISSLGGEIVAQPVPHHAPDPRIVLAEQEVVDLAEQVQLGRLAGALEQLDRLLGRPGRLVPPTDP